MDQNSRKHSWSSSLPAPSGSAWTRQTLSPLPSGTTPVLDLVPSRARLLLLSRTRALLLQRPTFAASGRLPGDMQSPRTTQVNMQVARLQWPHRGLRSGSLKTTGREGQQQRVQLHCEGRWVMGVTLADVSRLPRSSWRAVSP